MARASRWAIWQMTIPLNLEHRIGRWQDELFTILGDIEAWLDDQDRDEENPFLDAVDTAVTYIRAAHEELFWWEEECRIDEDVEW